MSRAGYNDDCEQWAMICWRGAVNSAIKGARGQAFLTELIIALDALPEKRLIAEELEREGAVCAIGAVGKERGVDMSKLDPDDPERVSVAFGIAPAMVREITFINDECGRHNETPEDRFRRVRKWAKDEIWNGRGCVADPYGEQALRMSRRLHWRSVIDWNEV